ncbi:MAG: hypothetical protein HN929_13435 [Chloroflexi bacterium]|nr:hypothetical protein [Chloroflexota bacterium]MBT7082442.1 hypothetical protein [Chloroflexota bacterium]MBT7290025.1 hypothetical protein [Chloroflexota bacterium]
MEFQVGPDAEKELYNLYGILSEAQSHLEKVEEYLYQEIKVVKDVSRRGTEDYRDLVFSMGHLGVTLTKQCDKIREAIKATMALPVVICELTPKSRRRERVTL